MGDRTDPLKTYQNINFYQTLVVNLAKYIYSGTLPDVSTTVTQPESTSKTDLISLTLRNDIFEGRLQPGAPLPSQRQIAERFGVSEATVAVAVGRLAHEALVVRRRGLGSYVRHQLPMVTASRTLHFVRALTPGGRERLNDLAFIEDCAAICDAKDFQGLWHHILHQDLARPETLLHRFRGARGVITKGVNIELAVMLHRQGIPVVAVFPFASELTVASAVCPCITYDRRAAPRLAVKHLVAMGYERIAYLGRQSMPLHTLGFFDAVREHKLPIPIEWAREGCEDNSEDHIKWLDGLLTAGDRPQALCCATDHVANRVERWLLDRGVSIPNDLAIIACDEGPEAIDAPVPITTIGDSRQEVCSRAIEIVEQIKPGFDPAAETARPQPIFTPLHLTVRQSSGAQCSDSLKRA